MKRAFYQLALILALLAALIQPLPARASSGSLGVQQFLSQQPGPLKAYRADGRSAAAIIESSSLYYGLSPRLHLALLEATANLLSDPTPPDTALSQPFGPGGSHGFAEQIEWASRELRAGLGPYARPPIVRFSDGLTFTLSLDQVPEGVAVQRFLAHGRSMSQWRAAVDAFGTAFERYFNNELVQIGIGSPQVEQPPPSSGFLGLPWPAGDRVVHLAYFDHVYPTVDTGQDGNTFVVTYLNQGNVQYNSHDGHDYYFPDQPIGTPILAAADGLAYPRTHRGNGVVIIHPGGYETVYWHLSTFAPVLRDKIDSDSGTAVRAGDVIGYSGTSGFVRGTPHLHFEVRRYGKQIDPYGWYGPGVDPCAIYAGCIESTWLWSDALQGSYDFTPPIATGGGPQANDSNPPIGTLAVAAPSDLLFLAHFDGHPVQSIGAGFPEIAGELRYVEGRASQALASSGAGLAYPSPDNLQPAAGSISLWAKLPEQYPSNKLRRHYLLATSANPNGAPDYIGTLALRRDMLGPDESPRWTFWTVGPDAASSHDLAVPDNLAPGWHHVAISWDALTGSKALYIDGVAVAQASGVRLPSDLGAVIQIGRFTYGGAPAGVAIDDLAIYQRALTAGEVGDLAVGKPGIPSPTVVTQRRVRLDTNAIDREGGIVSVQLGVDGTLADPQPYYDSYAWVLPADEGWHTVAARYTDRAGNSTTVSSSVLLNLAPQIVRVKVMPTGPLGATVEVSASDTDEPLLMQVSQRSDFADASWQPLRWRLFWAWDLALPQQIYVRVRDPVGNLSGAQLAAPPGQLVYLPIAIGGGPR